MSKAWILYDGRAEFQDTDDCSILEFLGTTRRDLKDGLHYWKGHDGVLAEYDEENSQLTNEKIIGHLREGRKALLAKCTAEAHTSEQGEKP